MPNQYERVLLTTSDGYVEIGHYSGSDLWTVEESFVYEMDEILAWQPLPDTYRKDEKNEN